MKVKVFCGLLFLTVLLIFSQNGPALSETLTIAGTGDSQVLVRALAERFEAKYPDPEGSTFWSKKSP